MKIFLTIFSCCAAFLLSAQDFKDQRIVYSSATVFLDSEMIDAWESGTDYLTANETKKYLEFQKRLKIQILERTLEKSNKFLSEQGAKVQDIETAGKFGMMVMTAEGYPNMMFPKKALKKKGAKLDVGEYFISYHISFEKDSTKPSLKGYLPTFSLEVKLFNVKGERLKNYKTRGISDKKMGVVSMESARNKEYFSRTDFDSIDWIMENFGAALDQAINEALPQLIN